MNKLAATLALLAAIFADGAFAAAEQENQAPPGQRRRTGGGDLLAAGRGPRGSMTR